MCQLDFCTTRLAKLCIVMPIQPIFGNDAADRLNQQPIYVAPQHTLYFAGRAKICYSSRFAIRTEASRVDIAVKLNVLAVCAVIAFVSAILLGAF